MRAARAISTSCFTRSKNFSVHRVFPRYGSKLRRGRKLTTALPDAAAPTFSLTPGYVSAVPGLTVASRERLPCHRFPGSGPGDALPLTPPEP